jgi:hypothetical protein
LTKFTSANTGLASNRQIKAINSFFISFLLN